MIPGDTSKLVVVIEIAPGITIVCRDDFRVPDEYEFLSYKLNPLLAELSLKYGGAEYHGGSRLTMWINEFDGARIEVNYSSGDQAPEPLTVSYLYLLRDAFTKHYVSFDEMRRAMVKVAAGAVKASPGMILDLDRVLEVLGCSMYIAGRRASDWRSEGMVRFQVRLNGKRRNIPETVDFSVYSRVGDSVTVYPWQVRVQDNYAVLEVPGYSIVKFSVAGETHIYGVGGSDTSVEILVPEPSGKEYGLVEAGASPRLKWALIAVGALVLLAIALLLS